MLGSPLNDVNRLRILAQRYPFLKQIAYPALALRRLILNQKESERRHILDNFRDLVVGDVQVRVAEFDAIFEMSPKSDLFSRMMVAGNYEPTLAGIALRSVKAGRDAIDVGANIGFYSVGIAKRLGDRKLLAVEPSAATADRLRRNVARNGVDGCVIVFHGAAADKAGTLTLRTITGKEEYSSLGNLVHPSILNEAESLETVSARTIDDLVMEHKLEPGFIKVDVEGAERLVFEGAKNTLKTFKPTILSELSDPLLKSNGSSSIDVIAFLKSHGYDVRDPHHPDLEPGSLAFSDIICEPRP